MDPDEGSLLNLEAWLEGYAGGMMYAEENDPEEDDFIPVSALDLIESLEEEFGDLDQDILEGAEAAYVEGWAEGVMLIRNDDEWPDNEYPGG